jgi:hypothetical protein
MEVQRHYRGLSARYAEFHRGGGARHGNDSCAIESMSTVKRDAYVRSRPIADMISGVRRQFGTHIWTTRGSKRWSRPASGYLTDCLPGKAGPAFPRIIG